MNGTPAFGDRVGLSPPSDTDGPPRRSSAEAGPSTSALLATVNLLLRHRLSLLALALAGATIMTLAGLLAPTRYTARLAFVPNGGGSALASFAGIAAQLGIPVPTEDAAESPEFYAELARGREILDQVAEARYLVPEVGVTPARLPELYRIEEETPARQLEETHERLRRDTRSWVDRRTGIVRLTVRAPWPGLAADLGSEMLRSLVAFDLETRRSRASAERKFIGERLTDARGAVRTAETRLEGFLDRNRRYQNSAQLLFEYERLQRLVSLRQQLFTTLSQAYEQAKIEEVRNTPVLSVVERPIRPASPDSRYLILRGAAGLVLGVLIGVVLAFSREFARRARRDGSPEIAEFDVLRAQVRRDVAGWFGRFRRRPAPATGTTETRKMGKGG